jgi:hypothetical protein
MVRANKKLVTDFVREAMHKKVLTLQQAARKQAAEPRGW